ncbi:MAG: hypothetical protein QOH94_2669, partial [Mycobacterium sp.]|nr:hypothetical protein [Mycobacterium sp.]
THKNFFSERRDGTFMQLIVVFLIIDAVERAWRLASPRRNTRACAEE